jgi:hypothetical protein
MAPCYFKMMATVCAMTLNEYYWGVGHERVGDAGDIAES